MTTPAISVLMGVCNRVEYFEEAVYSILNQTFTDFEFIIVDDASTDAVPEVLARLATEDSRIRVITNATNKHIPATLNIALQAAKAPYVAIMDSDDWSHPERLAKQYAFMEANPHISLCGTQIEIYETEKIVTFPLTDTAIRTSLFFGCFLHHPTAIFRKEAVVRCSQGYDEAMPYAQDYDLWVRLAKHPEIGFANLPDSLLRYRTHPEQKRINHYAVQKDITQKIRFNLQDHLGLAEPSIAMHIMLAECKRTKDPQELRQCGQWMQDILNANEQKNLYPHELFRDGFHVRWAKLCYRSVPSLPQARHIYKEYRPKPTSLLTELGKTMASSAVRRIQRIKKRFMK